MHFIFLKIKRATTVRLNFCSFLIRNLVFDNSENACSFEVNLGSLVQWDPLVLLVLMELRVLQALQAHPRRSSMSLCLDPPVHQALQASLVWCVAANILSILDLIATSDEIFFLLILSIFCL